MPAAHQNTLISPFSRISLRFCFATYAIFSYKIPSHCHKGANLCRDGEADSLCSRGSKSVRPNADNIFLSSLNKAVSFGMAFYLRGRKKRRFAIWNPCKITKRHRSSRCQWSVYASVFAFKTRGPGKRLFGFRSKIGAWSEGEIRHINNPVYLLQKIRNIYLFARNLELSGFVKLSIDIGGEKSVHFKILAFRNLFSRTEMFVFRRFYATILTTRGNILKIECKEKYYES